MSESEGRVEQEQLWRKEDERRKGRRWPLPRVKGV
jgi:hypothetical protein